MKESVGVVKQLDILKQALLEVRAYAKNPTMELARTGFSVIEKIATKALIEIGEKLGE